MGLIMTPVTLSKYTTLFLYLIESQNDFIYSSILDSALCTNRTRRDWLKSSWFFITGELETANFVGHLLLDIHSKLLQDYVISQHHWLIVRIISIFSQLSQAMFRSEVSICALRHPLTFGRLTVCQRKDVSGLLWESSFCLVHTPASWRSGPAWHFPLDQGHDEDCDVCTEAVAGNVDWHSELPAETSPNTDGWCQDGRSSSWSSWPCGKESLPGSCSSWQDAPGCRGSGTMCGPATL